MTFLVSFFCIRYNGNGLEAGVPEPMPHAISNYRSLMASYLSVNGPSRVSASPMNLLALRELLPPVIVCIYPVRGLTTCK